MIVQICPPGTGGVRDYADALARAWSVRDVASQLMEGTPGRLRPALDALPGAGGDMPLHLVLHFSGYGYAPRGLCGWLADDLAAFKAAQAQRVRLTVVFHELFATGAPWRSAFWLAPWQSQVARRLARLADGLWTNTGGHARWLHEAAGGATPLQMRPVFSNVGEPVDPPAWAVREPRAIVFGSAETRARAFADLRSHGPALARLGVREIVEVGSGDSQSAPARAPGIPVRHQGRLPAAELGTLLAGSRFGLLDYTACYLGKSGVFAAYAAHGCLAINTCVRDAEADDLRAGVHYVNTRASFDADAGVLAQMALRLHRWYGAHSLALQSHQLLQAATAATPAPALG